MLVTPPIAIVLVCVPTVVPVTFTVTVQEPVAGIVPPASETEPAACVAVPPHVVAAVAATVVSAAGRVSVKAAPVIAVVFELVSVIVRVDVPEAGIDTGANALATAGFSKTVSVAFTPLLSMVAVGETMRTASFRYADTNAEVTSTENEQLAVAAAMDPPLKSCPLPPLRSRCRRRCWSRWAWRRRIRWPAGSR